MKNRIILIISILSAVFAYGQVTLISAVEDKDYKVNQKITLTFVLKIEGNEYVQESPLRLPDFSKFNVIGNASDQNSFVDPEKKIVINEMVYQWVVSPKQAGKIKIGSALVDVNGHTYKTEPIDIFVKDADKKSESSADAYLSLEVDKKEVYENQPVRAVLKMFSKDIDNFRKVDHIRFANASAFQIQPLSLAKSDIEPVAQKPEWSSQVLAVYLIIPEEKGVATIPSFSAKLNHADNGVKISSPSVKISVKGFPKSAPAGYKKVIGKNFSLNLSSDDGDGNDEENGCTINKPIAVTLKFTGNGSFNQSEIPKLLPSPDYIFYPPTIDNRTRITANGAEGEIFAHYVVVPKKLGQINISTENFSYFNPVTQKFIKLAPCNLALNILTPDEVEGNKTAMEKMTGYTNSLMNTVALPMSKVDNKKDPKSKTLPILLVSLAGIATFLFWRKTKKNSKIKPELIPQNIENVGKEVSTKFDFSQLHQHLYEEKYSEFFADFDELMANAEERARSRGFKNVTDLAESMHGTRVAENFRALLQKIHIEKFAPIHSKNYMQQIFNEITTVFSQLQNSQ